MTPKQKRLLRDTWQAIEARGHDAGGLFYDRLFEIDPSTRQMFVGADMAVQSTKLMTALAGVVQGLDHFQVLKPTIEDLGRRHITYGVDDKHYDSVGGALLWTLKQTLGAGWTSEVQQAWADAYRLVVETMLDGANQQTVSEKATVSSDI